MKSISKIAAFSALLALLPVANALASSSFNPVVELNFTGAALVQGESSSSSDGTHTTYPKPAKLKIDTKVLLTQLARATGTTKLVNVASNLGSLAVFLLAGQVAVELALAIAVGSMTGATIGSRLATRHGARLIRPLLVVISLALTARLVWNWFAG